MARDAQKWATEIFDQDGTFQTSGKTFTGHEEMIAAAVHLFNLCTALKYDVHKIYSVSEGDLLKFTDRHELIYEILVRSDTY